MLYKLNIYRYVVKKYGKNVINKFFIRIFELIFVR